jgi:hypothetical protein
MTNDRSTGFARWGRRGVSGKELNLTVKASQRLQKEHWAEIAKPSTNNKICGRGTRDEKSHAKTQRREDGNRRLGWTNVRSWILTTRKVNARMANLSGGFPPPVEELRVS